MTAATFTRMRHDELVDGGYCGWALSTSAEASRGRSVVKVLEDPDDG